MAVSRYTPDEVVACYATGPDLADDLFELVDHLAFTLGLRPPTLNQRALLARATAEIAVQTMDLAVTLCVHQGRAAYLERYTDLRRNFRQALEESLALDL